MSVNYQGRVKGKGEKGKIKEGGTKDQTNERTSESPKRDDDHKEDLYLPTEL